jgi:hypothetical protein
VAAIEPEDRRGRPAAVYDRGMVIVKGADEPALGRAVHRLTGDLTVLADGRIALMTADEAVHDLGDVLAALVGEGPDALGDRHVGRVRLVLEVEDRHERLSSEGMVAFRP